MCLEGKDPKIYMKGIECIPARLLRSRHQNAETHDPTHSGQQDSGRGGVRARGHGGSAQGQRAPGGSRALQKLSQPPEEYKTVAPHVELAKDSAPMSPSRGSRRVPHPRRIRTAQPARHSRQRGASLQTRLQILRRKATAWSHTEDPRRRGRLQGVQAPSRHRRHQIGSIVKFLKVGERRKEGK